jgi:hypothetical protein
MTKSTKNHFGDICKKIEHFIEFMPCCLLLCFHKLFLSLHVHRWVPVAECDNTSSRNKVRWIKRERTELGTAMHNLVCVSFAGWRADEKAGRREGRQTGGLIGFLEINKSINK